MLVQVIKSSVQKTSSITSNDSDYLKTKSVEKTVDVQPHETFESSEKRAQHKACNCDRSNCLKLYCECFKAGELCVECNCKNCYNNTAYNLKRKKTINAILAKNKDAFKRRVTGVSKAGGARVTPLPVDWHTRHECHCSKSNCLKGYCECFQSGEFCSQTCHCLHCFNQPDLRDRVGVGSDSTQLYSMENALFRVLKLNDPSRQKKAELISNKQKSTELSIKSILTPHVDELCLKASEVFSNVVLESQTETSSDLECAQKLLSVYKWCLQTISSHIP